ncbi:MAG TPA: hypothetical protein V6C86_24360 [Oculatellaceae cyanobacterium]
MTVKENLDVLYPCEKIDEVADLFDDLRAQQEAEVREALGIKPDFEPQTEEDYDFIGNKFCALEEERDRVNAQHNRRLKDIQRKEDYLKFKWYPILEQFFESAKKRGSHVDLPSCRLQKRTVKAHWVVKSLETLKEHLKTLSIERLNELKVSPQTVTDYKSSDGWQAVKLCAQDGEVFPGVEYKSEVSTFTVTKAA